MKKMIGNICPEWQSVLCTIEDDTIGSFFNQDKTWIECFDCVARSITEEILNVVDDFFIRNWETTEKDNYIRKIVYEGKVRYIEDWKTYIEKIEKEAFVLYVRDLLLEEKEIRLYFCLRYCYMQFHTDLTPENKRYLKSFITDPFFLAEKTFKKAYNRVYSFIYKRIKIFEGEQIAKTIQEILDSYKVELYYNPTSQQTATIYLKGGIDDFVPLSLAHIKY